MSVLGRQAFPVSKFPHSNHEFSPPGFGLPKMWQTFARISNPRSQKVLNNGSKQRPRGARASSEASSENGATPGYAIEEGGFAWWLSDSRRKSRQEASGVNCLMVKRSIRQYEEFSHPGSLVIVGNVAPGAIVKASGDIVVLGRLLGKAYAGAGGDFGAVVIALSMGPSLIAIGDRIFSGPEGEPSQYPEIASISPSGTISVEPIGFFAPEPENDKTFKSRTPDPVMARLARDGAVNVKWNIEGQLQQPGSNWKSPAVASAVTGLYIMLAGFLVLVAPIKIFGLLFDPQTLSRGWIRVFGILAMVFGLYYLGATCGDVAGYGAYGFYASTVVGRTFIFLAFCLLVLVGELPAAAIVLAVVNLFGAISMLFALQRS